MLKLESKKLSLIAIRSDKPKELSELYELFGLNCEYHRHGKRTLHYSTEIGGIVFEIYPLTKNQENRDKTLRLGFTIDNLDATIEILKTRNVKIVREPKESELGYVSIVKDLDGRRIELKEKE